MVKESIYFKVTTILLFIILTSCAGTQIQDNTSFSYYFNIQRICYVYIDEEPLQKVPFRNAYPQSRIESSYLLLFSMSPNSHELTVSVERQNKEGKTNDIPEKLNALKNLVIESELLRRNDIEMIEFASFNIKGVNEAKLSVIELKPEAEMVVNENNLIREMRLIIDAIFSRDASEIKWLYPLEQPHIYSDSVFGAAITLKTYEYDIQIPISVFHNTENSYNWSSNRNDKIFHKIISLSLQNIKIADTNMDVKFGTTTKYHLLERYEPK